MTANKGFGSPIWEIVYISEVNRARKVKSNAQVAMNKNSDPVQKWFLWVAGEDSASNSNFSELLKSSEAGRARKLILGMHVKANSRIYDVAR